MKISDILLVSDIDGTLLTTGKEISLRNQQALREFREAGGRFTVATGRSVISASQYIRRLESAGISLDAPAILFNGAAIYDFSAQRMLWHTRVPEELPRYLSPVLERFPQVGIEVLYEDETLVLSWNEYVRGHLEIERLPYRMAELREVSSGAIKVLFALEHGLIPAFARFLEERAFPGVCYVESAEMYYEMLPTGNSKGEALERLAQITGTPAAHIAAAGDYNNDIEMLRTAGLGAAMGNALDAVKNAADLVVASNDEDGLAELIGHLMNRCS